MSKAMDAIKKIIGNVAPVLATALGSPLAGAAVAMLSNAILGKKDGSAEEIATQLNLHTEDGIIKAQQAENNFKVQMESLGVDLEALRLQDIQNAREIQLQRTGLDKYLEPSLAIIITVGVFVIFWLLMEINFDQHAKDLLNILSGSIMTAWIQVISYYFGSSKGSRIKDEFLTK